MSASCIDCHEPLTSADAGHARCQRCDYLNDRQEEERLLLAMAHADPIYKASFSLASQPCVLDASPSSYASCNY